MNKRSRALQSTKYIKKKQRKMIFIISLFIVSSVSLLTTFIFALRLSYFQISSVEIKGNVTLDSYEIKEKILNNLQGNYLWVIPKSNILFYPKNLIKNVLIDDYKRIEKISIKRNNISNIEVVITERLPVALVCEGFHEENNDNCFFVDKNGYVFGKSPLFSENVFLRYYITTNKGDDLIGSNFISSNKFIEFQKFIEDINRSNISIVGILLGDNGAYELYIKNIDNTEAVVYFDDSISLDNTSSNLIAFWNNFLTNKDKATTAFDYINLRFGNNIFYMTK